MKEEYRNQMLSLLEKIPDDRNIKYFLLDINEENPLNINGQL